MKKPYIKPEFERLLITSVEDILAGTSYDDNAPDADEDYDAGKWD